MLAIQDPKWGLERSTLLAADLHPQSLAHVNEKSRCLPYPLRTDGASGTQRVVGVALLTSVFNY